MIIGVTGKPRHGKTLRLVWLMGQYAMAGRFCCSNVLLKDSCPYKDLVYRLDEPGPVRPDGSFSPSHWPVFNVIDFAYPGYYPIAFDREGNPTRYYRAFWHYLPRGACVFVSEATNYWDSLNFASMPEICRDYWTQHAKFGHTIVLDFQNIDNLYNRIRRMMETFIVCEHNARVDRLQAMLPLRWSKFCSDSFSHESCLPKHYIESGAFWYSEAIEMFDWYDTLQTYGGFAAYKLEDIYSPDHVYAILERDRQVLKEGSLSKPRLNSPGLVLADSVSSSVFPEISLTM